MPLHPLILAPHGQSTLAQPCTLLLIASLARDGPSAQWHGCKQLTSGCLVAKAGGEHRVIEESPCGRSVGRLGAASCRCHCPVLLPCAATLCRYPVVLLTLPLLQDTAPRSHTVHSSDDIALRQRCHWLYRGR